MRDKYNLLPLFALFIITVWPRLVNLGYSDYLGDEIKALARLAPGQSLANFLLQQRKGPVEFLVTYLIGLFHPSFDNHFLTRLPFTLVGILGVFIFYQLIKMHWGARPALFATLLLATNGLFIGLNRIVQYQPFTILFSLLALYAFSLAVERESWQVAGVYTGMILWAMALLSHYDGVFIAPFAIYLLYRWYTCSSTLPSSTRRWHLALSAVLSAMLLASFYIPFAVSVNQDTLVYWEGRIFDVPSKIFIPSSIVTFKIYNPLLAIYLYPVLMILSLFRLRKVLPLLVWFIFSWIVLERIIYDPGTHIYAYLLPATAMAGIGMAVLDDWVVRIVGGRFRNQTGRWLSRAGQIALFIFLALLAHFIFVDTTPEYPWERRGFLLWTLEKPDPKYHIWAYGFNYNRHWDDINAFVVDDNDADYYFSNEKIMISNKYVPLPSYSEYAGYYIHIYNPQSFRNRPRGEKARYWAEKYPPVKVFEVNGRRVSEIYKIPPGKVNEIKNMGY